jgi:hypothetical protein
MLLLKCYRLAVSPSSDSTRDFELMKYTYFTASKPAVKSLAGTRRLQQHVHLKYIYFTESKSVVQSQASHTRQICKVVTTHN